MGSRRYTVGDAYQYTEAEIRHRLLGDKGFGHEDDRLLLSDELISAIGTLLFNASKHAWSYPKTTRFLSTYQLCALFQLADGRPPSFPKQSTLGELFEQERLVGVAYMPPCHWVAVEMERIFFTWHVSFYDSMGSSNEMPGLKQKAEHLIREVSRGCNTQFTCEYSYRWPVPRQNNPYDCGIIALSWVEQMLNDRISIDQQIGDVKRTALQRVKFARMLTELGTVVVVVEEDPCVPSPQQQPTDAVNIATAEDPSDDVKIIRPTHRNVAEVTSIVELIERFAPSHDDIIREAIHHGFFLMESDRLFLESMKESEKWSVQVITPSISDARYWSSKPKSVLLIGRKGRRYSLILEYNISTGMLCVPSADSIIWNGVHIDVPIHTCTVYVGTTPPQQEIQLLLKPENRQLRIKNMM